MSLLLIELHYTNEEGAGVLRLASSSYRTDAADTPSNTLFYDRLASIPDLETGEESSLTLGELEFYTEQPAHDLLSYNWGQVNLYLGETSQTFAEFTLLLAAEVSQLLQIGPTKLQAQFTTTISEFNEVRDSPTGNAASGEDVVLPDPVGSVYNVTPIILNSFTLLYAVGGGTVGTVRDQGVEVAFFGGGAPGHITLAAPPAGDVTMDVSSYYAQLGVVLAATVGVDPAYPEASTSTFAVGGLPATHPIWGASVGGMAEEGGTTRELMETLVTGLDISVNSGALNEVLATHFCFEGESLGSVTADNILENTFSHEETILAAQSVEIKYSKNQTVLSSLAGKLIANETLEEADTASKPAAEALRAAGVARAEAVTAAADAASVAATALSDAQTLDASAAQADQDHDEALEAANISGNTADVLYGVQLGLIASKLFTSAKAANVLALEKEALSVDAQALVISTEAAYQAIIAEIDSAPDIEVLTAAALAEKEALYATGVRLQAEWSHYTHTLREPYEGETEKVHSVETSLSDEAGAAIWAEHLALRHGQTRYKYTFTLINYPFVPKPGELLDLSYPLWGVEGRALVLTTSKELTSSQTTITVLV